MNEIYAVMIIPQYLHGNGHQPNLTRLLLNIILYTHVVSCSNFDVTSHHVFLKLLYTVVLDHLTLQRGMTACTLNP